MNKLSKNLVFFIFISLLCGIGACGTDDDCCVQPPDPQGAQIWIANEGQFNMGNSSLDLYDTENEAYFKSVFENKNGRGVGDILQSITFYGNKAYLIVNSSQRIDVIDMEDYSLLSTISSQVYSPRYGVVVGDKIYISDLFNPYIYILDPATEAIVDSISTGVPVEEMIVHGGNIFASAYNFTTAISQVFVVSPTQKTIIDNIEVGLNPNAMVKDRENMIWVMCDGQYNPSLYRSEHQSIYRINPNSRTVDKSFDFTTFSPQYPNRLAINENDGQHIYFMGPSGLHRMEISATNIPEEAHITYNGAPYGIGINPINDEIYIGDAADFSSEGTISVFNQDGTLTETLNAGFYPSRFYFR